MPTGVQVSMPYGRLPHITIADASRAIIYIYIYIYIYMYVSFVLFHFCYRRLLACTTLWSVLRSRFFGRVYRVSVFVFPEATRCLACELLLPPHCLVLFSYVKSEAQPKTFSCFADPDDSGRPIAVRLRPLFVFS